MRSAGGDPGVSTAFRFPEHVVNGLHSLEKFVGFALVHMNLAGAAELGGIPECGVQLGECSQVLRLEVIGPENQQLLLGLLSLLLLDRHKAGVGVFVGRPAGLITIRRLFQRTWRLLKPKGVRCRRLEWGAHKPLRENAPQGWANVA